MSLNYSTADEEHSVFVRKLQLFYIFSFHLYVLTTLTCGPDDADRQSQVSAALSSLPFLFGSYLSRFSLLCYKRLILVLFNNYRVLKSDE